jgi:hypothetical protein
VPPDIFGPRFAGYFKMHISKSIIKMDQDFVQISKANAFKAFRSADKSGKKLLVDLLGQDVLSEKVTDRIKSYSDACSELGILPLTISDFSALPEQDRESTYAYHQITMIVRALNEGWEPDWNDSNQYKYYPYFQAAAGSGFSYGVFSYVLSYSYLGSRLVFKTSELAVYAGQQFLSIYNQFLKL